MYYTQRRPENHALRFTGRAKAADRYRRPGSSAAGRREDDASPIPLIIRFSR